MQQTARVTEVLREAILNGSLKPGAPLREGQVAASLGVSRAPVREALRSLEKEGMVTKLGYRGAIVASARPGVMGEVASVRARIEPYAVERSLPVFIADGFDQLELLVRRLAERAQSGCVRSAVDAHIAFHRAFYENADHRLLLDTWRTLEPAQRLFLLSVQGSAQQTELLIQSHLALLDVVRSGDLSMITQQIIDHVVNLDYLTLRTNQDAMGRNAQR